MGGGEGGGCNEAGDGVVRMMGLVLSGGGGGNGSGGEADTQGHRCQVRCVVNFAGSLVLFPPWLSPARPGYEVQRGVGVRGKPGQHLQSHVSAAAVSGRLGGWRLGGGLMRLAAGWLSLITGQTR